jgi:two-component system cell cycle sensor histidine kinase/response regulator CckA
MAQVDSSQIEQVLLNLFINAADAMPGGGELRIETSNAVLDKRDVMAYKVAPGNYVKITVKDTGVGMDEETRQRAFEPFFTTKEEGRGTGLGLASAYGITKNHGGIITVESEEGKGAQFHIYLPASPG